jgi:hypothetical protein
VRHQETEQTAHGEVQERVCKYGNQEWEIQNASVHRRPGHDAAERRVERMGQAENESDETGLFAGAEDGEDETDPKQSVEEVEQVVHRLHRARHDVVTTGDPAGARRLIHDHAPLRNATVDLHGSLDGPAVRVVAAVRIGTVRLVPAFRLPAHFCTSLAASGRRQRPCQPGRVAAFAALATCAFLTTCTPPAAPPLPLEPADFVLAGVPPDADSAEIRMSFGQPDSVVLTQDPYEAGIAIENWYYPGVIVRYSGGAVPASFLIDGYDEGTARGIRVGDPVEPRDVQRYGEPLFRYDHIWTYAEPGADTEPYVSSS